MIKINKITILEKKEHLAHEALADYGHFTSNKLRKYLET